MKDVVCDGLCMLWIIYYIENYFYDCEMVGGVFILLFCVVCCWRRARIIFAFRRGRRARSNNLCMVLIVFCMKVFDILMLFF